MKSIIFYALLLAFPLFISTSYSQETGYAQNITFNDIEGTSNDLYEYIDSGFVVILDFSFKTCYPCYEWSINVGHDLWEQYGPDGENILRMFFFDVNDTSIASNQDVIEYTQQWGVEYPIINLNSGNEIPEYPQEGYPTVYFICPSDTSYIRSGGYGYPHSEQSNSIFHHLCQGGDTTILESYNLFSISEADRSTLCDTRPILFSPKLLVLHNDVLNSEQTYIDMNYHVEIYKNGEYHSTQEVDPVSDGYIFIDDAPTLQPIEVNSNDVLTFVLDYPNDPYSYDDTLTITIPNEISTPTSSSTIKVYSQSQFLIYDPDGSSELYEPDQNGKEISLVPDSCYSIEFFNPTYESAYVEDVSNGLEVISYELGEYMGSISPKLYFHVSDSSSENTTSLESFGFSDMIESIFYIDVLGRKYDINEYESLPIGFYTEVKQFKSGKINSQKLVKRDK